MCKQKIKRRSGLVINAEILESRRMLSTYTVNTLSDSANPGSGLLTLRQAVAGANLNTGNDKIVFAAGLLNAGRLNTIVLSGGEIDFTDPTGTTTIQGPGDLTLSVSGNQLSRVFGVLAGATVSINGLSITDGATVSDPGASATGGGVQNAGSLTLNGVDVSANTATGGADNMSDNGDGGAADGGGIYNTGTLALINSSVSGNTAAGGESYSNVGGDADGAGIYSSGSLSIAGSSIVGNNASGGGMLNVNHGDGGNAAGGGILCSGQLTLNSSTVSGNSATGGPGASGGDGDGGGVYSSSASIFSVDTFSNNQVTAGVGSGYGASGSQASGGAICSIGSVTISSSTLTGNHSTGGQGPYNATGPSGDSYGGAIAAGGALTVINTTISANVADATGAFADNDTNTLLNASAIGGGIYAAQMLDVSNCVISSNTAQGASGDAFGGVGGVGQGGGIAMLGTGTLTGTSIVGNFAIGGVVSAEDASAYPSGDGEGGGVSSSGVLTVTSTTLSGNEATGGAGSVPNGYSNTVPGIGGDGLGAGIYSPGTLTVQNSTLTANTAAGGFGPDGSDAPDASNGGNGGNGEGGGIYSTPQLLLFDSTIVQNTATGGAGGQAYTSNGTTGMNGIPGVAEGGGIYAGKNSVLDNSILSVNNAASGADVYSPLSALSADNLIGYGGGLTNGVNGNQIGVHNPMLSALGSYGGPTQTMVPLAGSPAIQAGSNSAIPAGLTTDQRGTGYPRIFNTTVNIGAVEYHAAQSVSSAPVITFTPPASQTATIGQNKSFTIGSFTESNAVAPFAVTISWGDGTANTVASGLTIGEIPSQAHTYAVAGSETVSVYVSDASGNRSAAETFAVIASAPALATSSPVAVSATTLTASTDLTAAAAPITFTAVVIGATGTLPTGMVTFSSDGVTLGTASLAAGIATFTTSSLASGADSITASYGGDAHYLTAALPPVAVNVYTPSKIIPILLTRPALPALDVEGQALKSTVSILLTNTGALGKGLFTIKWYLSRPSSLDGSQTLIATTHKYLALNTGRQARIAQPIRSLPASLPAGNYYLIAEMTDPSGSVNAVASQTTITLAAPLVSLMTSLGAVTPAMLPIGKSGSILVTLTNNGNITAAGLLTLTISPALNDVTLPTALAALRINASIRAGKSRMFRVRLKIPPSLATGTYLPVASGTFSNQTLSDVGVIPFSVG